MRSALNRGTNLNEQNRNIEVATSIFAEIDANEKYTAEQRELQATAKESASYDTGF